MRATLWFCLWLFSYPVLSQQPFPITDAAAVHFPLIQAEIWEDPSATATFGKAQQQNFLPINQSYLSLGYSKSAYWIRLQLRQESSYNDWRLLNPTSYTDELDYYIEDDRGGWYHLHTGRKLPFAFRQNTEHVGFVFPLDFPKGETRTVYFRLVSNPLNFPLQLLRYPTLDDSFERLNLYYGFYFGVLFVMIFYNLFIYFSLRNPSYLFYVLSISMTLLVFSGSSGYAYRYLYPDWPMLAYHHARVAMGLLVIGTALFALYFLEIKRISRWLYWVFIVDIVLAVIAILLDVTGLRTGSTNTLITLHSPLLLLAGIVAWRKGNSSARYYVFAWVAFIVGGLLATLRNAGVLPAIPLTDHGAEVGSMLEVVLLSLTLAERYRQIRQEKEAAIQQTLYVQEEANRTLEKKVQERTLALQDRNEELNQMNEELDSTLNMLQIQKHDIENKNDYINAGIKYAQRIQTGLMPSEGFLRRLFADVFVLNRPRDIVSGDFYYTLRRANGQLILALADCTGHGVPGAFMSMMGVNLMERVFSEDENRLPDEAIRRLDLYLKAIFASSQERIRDGMDAAVCLLSPTRDQLFFAGAKLPLVHVRQGEVSLYKGSSYNIGGDARVVEGNILLQTIACQPGDRFFMFSDGFQDQFGGPKNRKFLSRNFRELLGTTAHLPLAEQKEILNQRLEDWMNEGQENQTDDVLVIGFSI
ncbi:MAG: 7TM diverse intracellular signaling domain-containing protein [Bernardetiaceae bacterium]